MLFHHTGCWKARCQPVGDGDPKDTDLCLLPVEVSPDLRIAKCMHLITPEDVIRCIEIYYAGGALHYNAAPAHHSPRPEPNHRIDSRPKQLPKD